METWKDIVGYETYYQVSNIGRVKRLERITETDTGFRKLPGKTLSLIKSRRGYESIMLSKNNVQRVFRVHRLVAFSFIPNPENKKTVNHKNGVRHDNRVENLEWCTTSENHIHAFRVLNRFHGNRKPIIKLSLSGEFIKEYDSTFQAARELKRSNKNISNCLRNESHTAYGYKWKFK